MWLAPASSGPRRCSRHCLHKQHRRAIRCLRLIMIPTQEPLCGGSSARAEGARASACGCDGRGFARARALPGIACRVAFRILRLSGQPRMSTAENSSREWSTFQVAEQGHDHIRPSAMRIISWAQTWQRFKLNPEWVDPIDRIICDYDPYSGASLRPKLRLRFEACHRFVRDNRSSRVNCSKSLSTCPDKIACRIRLS